jgi:hypothetical protein
VGYSAAGDTLAGNPGTGGSVSALDSGRGGAAGVSLASAPVVASGGVASAPGVHDAAFAESPAGRGGLVDALDVGHAEDAPQAIPGSDLPAVDASGAGDLDVDAPAGGAAPDVPIDTWYVPFDARNWTVDVGGEAGPGVWLVASTWEVDFGSAGLGRDPQPVDFVISNRGNVATGALDVRITGPDAVDFVITQTDCVSLSPSGTCTVSVASLGESLGLDGAVATLTIADLRLTGAEVSISLVYAPTFPSFLTGAASVADLGSAVVGGLGAVITVVVTNGGGQPSGPLTVDLVGSEAVIAADNCTGLSLSRTRSCTFGLQLAPTSVGAKNVFVKINGTSGGFPAVMSFVGTGTTS